MGYGDLACVSLSGPQRLRLDACAERGLRVLTRESGVCTGDDCLAVNAKVGICSGPGNRRAAMHMEHDC